MSDNGLDARRTKLEMFGSSTLDVGGNKIDIFDSEFNIHFGYDGNLSLNSVSDGRSIKVAINGQPAALDSGAMLVPGADGFNIASGMVSIEAAPVHFAAGGGAKGGVMPRTETYAEIETLRNSKGDVTGYNVSNGQVSISGGQFVVVGEGTKYKTGSVLSDGHRLVEGELQLVARDNEVRLVSLGSRASAEMTMTLSQYSISSREYSRSGLIEAYITDYKGVRIEISKDFLGDIISGSRRTNFEVSNGKIVTIMKDGKEVMKVANSVYSGDFKYFAQFMDAKNEGINATETIGMSGIYYGENHPRNTLKTVSQEYTINGKPAVLQLAGADDEKYLTHEGGSTAFMVKNNGISTYKSFNEGSVIARMFQPEDGAVMMVVNAGGTSSVQTISGVAGVGRHYDYRGIVREFIDVGANGAFDDSGTELKGTVAGQWRQCYLATTDGKDKTYAVVTADGYKNSKVEGVWQLKADNKGNYTQKNEAGSATWIVSQLPDGERLYSTWDGSSANLSFSGGLRSHDIGDITIDLDRMGKEPASRQVITDEAGRVLEITRMDFDRDYGIHLNGELSMGQGMSCGFSGINTEHVRLPSAESDSSGVGTTNEIVLLTDGNGFRVNQQRGRGTLGVQISLDDAVSRNFDGNMGITYFSGGTKVVVPNEIHIAVNGLEKAYSLRASEGASIDLSLKGGELIVKGGTTVNFARQGGFIDNTDGVMYGEMVYKERVGVPVVVDNLMMRDRIISRTIAYSPGGASVSIANGSGLVDNKLYISAKQYINFDNPVAVQQLGIEKGIIDSAIDSTAGFVVAGPLALVANIFAVNSEFADRMSKISQELLTGKDYRDVNTMTALGASFNTGVNLVIAAASIASLGTVPALLAGARALAS